MPYFKYVFTFTQFNQQWSEIWYGLNADLPTAASLLTVARVQPFVTPCCSSVTLIKARISDVANNRTSVVLQFNLFGGAGSVSPDVTNTAALLNISAPSVGATRKVWKRGLLDADVVRSSGSGLSLPSPNLNTNLAVYFANLVSQGFMVQAQTKVAIPPVPPNVWTNFSTVSATAGNQQLQIACPVPLTPAQYSLINITRVAQKEWPGLHGIFSVLQSAAGVFTIGWNSPNTIVAANLAGRWRPVNYQYGNVVALGTGFQEFTSRKTGKNSQAGRGARSAQRLRHAL
jgi:hypothetical protein